jgi:hypothetical protein
MGSHRENGDTSADRGQAETDLHHDLLGKDPPGAEDDAGRC